MNFRQSLSALVALYSLFCLAPSGLAADPSPPLGVGTVVGENVNVRGRATLASEIITRVQRGEKVTVLEEVTLSKPKPDEPTQWYRIALPPNTPVWVHGDFLDDAKSTKRRLNLRGGPGENYSILGRLEKGTAVKEIRRKEEWVEIETPSDSYAFVAADLVEFIGSFVARANNAESSATPPAASTPATAPASVAPPTEKPTETPITLVADEKVARSPVVPEAPALTVVEVKVDPPVVAAAPPSTPVPVIPSIVAQTAPTSVAAPAPSPSTPAPTAPPLVATAVPAPSPSSASGLTPIVGSQPADASSGSEKPTRRLVAREGLISGTLFNSIQAPTYFGLRTLQDGRLINYLHAGKLGLKLEAYKGRKVLITGEEFIDKRWPRIPVLELESIEASP